MLANAMSMERSDSLSSLTTARFNDVRQDPVSRMPSLKSPLKRHHSELSGLSSRLQQLHVSMVSQSSSDNVGRRLPMLANEGIRRRESLIKAVALGDARRPGLGHLMKSTSSSSLKQDKVGWTRVQKLFVSETRKGQHGEDVSTPSLLQLVLQKQKQSSCQPEQRGLKKNTSKWDLIKKGSFVLKKGSFTRSFDSLDDRMHQRRQSIRQVKVKRKQSKQSLLRRKSSNLSIISSSSVDGTIVKKRLTRAQIERLRRKAALDKFRRAVRTVQVLLRAVDDIKSTYRRRKSEWDRVLNDCIAVPATPTARHDSSEKGHVMFNPSDFKPRNKGVISHDAKRILSKSPENRTTQEIRTVQVSLQSAMDSFTEFPLKMQESIAKVAWYEKFEPNRVIIRQGHIPEFYYLILAGTAVITVSSSDDSETGDPSIQHVAYLNKGNSFGEVALMQQSRRAASVICKETLELLTMNREDFLNIFMHRSENGRPDFLDFLTTLPMLRDLPLHTLPNDDPTVCLFTFFRRGVVICKDDISSDWIYVVKSGSCRVLKKLAAPTELFEARSALMGIFHMTEIHAGNFKEPWEIRLQRKPDKPKQDFSESKLASSSFVKLPKISVTASSGNQRPPFLRKQSKVQMDLPDGPFISKFTCPPEEEKTVYLQIQQISESEVFGLQSIIFLHENEEDTQCGSASVTLVSDGAECVLISKKFFKQHLTAKHRKQLEAKISPYPSEKCLYEKLQQQTTWEQYKCRTMHSAIQRNSKVIEDH